MRKRKIFVCCSGKAFFYTPRIRNQRKDVIMRTEFSSESVTEGHPDKVCDQIADAILDECLRQDPYSRVACEVVAAPDYLLIFGEVTTSAQLDACGVARRVIREIGYTRPEEGFSDACQIEVRLNTQSPDIALGVDKALESRAGGGDPLESLGAGDQGMVFGYASGETADYMPLAPHLAHALTRRTAQVRKAQPNSFLRPDGKALVAVEYENGVPLRVPAIVLSTQHEDWVSQERLREYVQHEIIEQVIPPELLIHTRYFINPTGRFVTGGPAGDSGLTGRKIIVDTYGGAARHGGGSFSGKDPTKVDRSAAYMARYAAKNLVAAGAAERCELEIAYAIGCARPVSLLAETFGTGKVSAERLQEIIDHVFDFRPAAILETLDLRRPIYLPTAAYGHFGRPGQELPWEKLDRVKEIQAYL